MMGVARAKLEKELSSKVPNDVLINLINEYQHIKQQFFLRKFQPSELNGGRFCECVLRLLEYLSSGTYTPFGSQLRSEQIIKGLENITTLPDTLRIFIPRLVRVVLDVRNKRDVAHIGGEVSPNYSDSLLVVQATDWILTELVRHFHMCPIAEAQKIVDSLNEVKIPVVAEIDGFIRVQNTQFDTRSKILTILYYKQPNKVSDADLLKWLRYSNGSRFKKELLTKLNDDALIHYEGGHCVLLPKGIFYVEQNISLSLLS